MRWRAPCAGLGLGRKTEKHPVRIPRHFWQREVARSEHHGRHRLDFMSKDHHAVRDFVVLELPRCGAPISPGEISARLGLSLERTVAILDDLEKGMTSLYRNAQGEVTWAYPVTVDQTPHHIRFSSGEQVYAA